MAIKKKKYRKKLPHLFFLYLISSLAILIRKKRQVWTNWRRKNKKVFHRQARSCKLWLVSTLFCLLMLLRIQEPIASRRRCLSSSSSSFPCENEARERNMQQPYCCLFPAYLSLPHTSALRSRCSINETGPAVVKR